MFECDGGSGELDRVEVVDGVVGGVDGGGGEADEVGGGVVVGGMGTGAGHCSKK